MILEQLTCWLFRIKFFTELPEVIEIFRQRKFVMIFYFFPKVTGDTSFTGFTLLHINCSFTLTIGIQSISPKSNFSNSPYITKLLLFVHPTLRYMCFFVFVFLNSIVFLSKIWGFSWAKKKRTVYNIQWSKGTHTASLYFSPR